MTNFLKGKGFYLALALCVVAAGATGFIAIKRAVGAAENSTLQAEEQRELNFPDLKEAREPLNDIKKDLTPQSNELNLERKQSGSLQQQSSQQDSLSSSKEQTEQQKQQKFSISLPIPKGEITEPYSGGELVKNKTLGDWRTHGGADIACEKGADVLACCDGTVGSIYKDELWGGCAEIKHEGGYTSIYKGVDTKGKLKTGETIKEGDVIGTASEIPCELLSATHIHFEIKQGEKLLNPLDFVRK